MQLLFDKHQDWINIVKSFGLEEDVCEDIVQEMYYKIQLKLEKISCGILGLDKIGIDRNFLDIGGHSLRVI